MEPNSESARSLATSAARSAVRVLVGAPRDLRDRSIFHQLSLVPFLAWVGSGQTDYRRRPTVRPTPSSRSANTAISR
jgi:hypothetical protein